MEPTDVRDAFVALAREISAKCDLYPGVNMHHGPAVSCSIYPNGIVGKVILMAHAETWEDLLGAARETWAEHSDLHAANTIKAMALAIIRLTAERGDCTDAALRAEFDGQDVIRFGERAVAMANEMAGNGPFSIVPVSGANSAEAA